MSKTDKRDLLLRVQLFTSSRAEHDWLEDILFGFCPAHPFVVSQTAYTKGI